jgi:hypothetical protein
MELLMPIEEENIFEHSGRVRGNGILFLLNIMQIASMI